MAAFAAMGALASGRAFAADPAAPAALTDGTYTATVDGMNDKIEVTMVIEGGKIADVQVADNSETPGIGGRLTAINGDVVTGGGASPCDLLPQLVAENNSLVVDMVTGASVTSAMVIAAMEDCVKQAGGDPADFQTPIDYPAYGDAEADLVIVGGGGAGLVAALTAAKQGKKVIVLEKNGECGGDTLVCGGVYNCPDEALQAKVEMGEATKALVGNALTMTSDDSEKQAALEEMQALVQEQWDEYKASGRTDLFDTKEWYALQTWINGDMVADPELVKVLTYNAYDGLEFLDELGMVWEDKIGQGPGALWQRTHTSSMPMGTGMVSTYFAQLDNYADLIEVRTEATATKLVMEDGKAVGVVATDNHNGSEFTVKGAQGVVLATGGFAANSKMVQENNITGKWPDLSEVWSTNRFSCSQGDGIAMAQEFGVDTVDMDQIQMLYMSSIKNGLIMKYPPRNVSHTDQLISINKEGKRFVQEEGRRDQICLAILQQPDQMFYMLESGDGDDYVDIHSDEWRSADGFTFQYLEENGYIVWDDTLEGLAGKLDMDPDTLQATVDAFNEAVETGQDEFGRTLFTCKLENGPWVATPHMACVHHTMGGLKIDTQAHVLDAGGAAISGLAAAGEITGGIHGGNRLGGNAVVDTVVFGKLACETLVSEG